MLATFTAIVGFMLGLLIGLALWHKAKSRGAAEAEQLRLQVVTLEKDQDTNTEKLGWVEQAEEKMRDAFKALASDTLKENSKVFSEATKKDIQGVVGPLKENLDSLGGHVRELEKERQGDYKSLERQLLQLQETHKDLQYTTTTLSQALKSSTVRGRWGEIQLRRVVELAGMEKHVAYDEQTSTDQGRPDMIVHLPHRGVLPIDAKVPMDAYLAAMQASDEKRRKGHLEDHSRAMRSRVKELGLKAYQNQFESTPEFVVMFVPNEACLGAAFEFDAELLEYAFENKVLLSSPVTLLALLHSVAYGWQQQAIAANAKKIEKEGKTLYGRLETFIQHLAGLGENLNRSVERYNQAVGSLEKRLIPAARRFEELGISNTELNAPGEIEKVPSIPTAEIGPGTRTD